MMVRQTYPHETAQVRRIAAQALTRWIWTRHARERAQERCITPMDIQLGLMRGRVVEIEPVVGAMQWKFRAEMDEGKRVLTAVLRLEEQPPTIIILTVWAE